MSVRPTVAFICGIDDAQENDPRYTKPDFDVQEEMLPYNEDVFLGQREIFFDEVYICGNPCDGLGTFHVAGYVISEGDEDLARGVNAALGWGTDDKIVIVKPDPMPSEWIQNQYAEREGKDVVESANAENRWIETYTPWYTDLYYRRAIYILHQAGWTGVTRSMLKFMLVLYWS